MGAGQKVFSEQEAADIVRRAVELQEEGQDPPYTPGITPDELQRIAKEIGVDPKYIERAVREALAPESKKGIFNLTEEFERVVDCELSQENFDVLLEHLKPGLNNQQIAQVGRTLRGPSKSGPVSLAHVNVNSRNGRTKINVRSSPLLAYLIGLHPALIGTMIAMGALSEKGMLAAGIATSVGLLTAGGIAFKQLVNLGHRNARKLAEALEAKVAEEGSVAQRLDNASVSQGDVDEELRQRL